MGEQPVIRSISVLTGAVQALADSGLEAEAAPDGQQIVYVDGTSKEIRIAGSQGESPRTFFRAPEGEVVASVHWLPGGKRIGYLRGRDGAPSALIETLDLNGRDARPVVEVDSESIAFASDGQVFYTTIDVTPQPGASLWAVRINPDTGVVAGRPVKLATWAGAVSAGPLSISADGRRLAFAKQFVQSDVYLLQLDATGNAVVGQRQLTTDTQVDWPSQWSRDGSSFLFFSNRNGALNAFRQPVAAETPEPVITGPTHIRVPQMTSDGKWIVYVEMTTAPQSARVMRIPAGGGPAQPVMTSSSQLETSTLQFFAAVPGTTGAGARSFPDVRCPARAAQGSCLLVEARPGTRPGAGNRLVLSRFDPASGDVREVGPMVEDHPGLTFWDASPDGKTVAYGQFSWTGGDRITLWEIATGERHDLQVSGVKNMNGIAWASDGRSLLATVLTIRSGEVLRIGLDGTAHVLRSFESQTLLNPLPSPNDRSLLVGLQQANANVWVAER